MEAAGKLKEEESALRLAKVDDTEEKELAEEFDIGGFPTLKLFVDGDRKQPVEYTGEHTHTHTHTHIYTHTLTHRDTHII